MSLKTLISKSKAVGATAVLAQSIQKNIIDNSLIPQNISSMAISTEDNEQDIAELSRTAGELGDSLASIRASFESEGNELITLNSQVTAGQLAGLVAGDAGAFMSRDMRALPAAGKNSSVVGNDYLEDAQDGYGFSMEAYDDRENKNGVLYAITYNIQASRQDELGEAFFPTIVISPDEVGLSIETRVVSVYDDFQRDVSGTTDGGKFNSINILRAYRDAGILGNETTKIIPVKSTASTALFSSVAGLDSTVTSASGESVNTGYLKFDTPYSLLAVSQTPLSVNKGLADSTDSLSPMINLDKIALYHDTGAAAAAEDYTVINVNGLPKSNFTYSTQGDDREMTLAFDTSSIVIDANTITATNGAVWSGVAGLPPGTKMVLSMSVYGSGQLETGDTNVFANSITLIDALDTSGNSIKGTPTYTAAETLVSDMSFEGYTLEAFRTNANRRDRGRLIKSNKFVQSYAVPVRAPVTTLRPTGANEDMEDLKALVNVTHVRTSNSAVKAIVDAAGILSSSVNNNSPVTDVLGVGRFLIKPYYKFVNLDMVNSIDSMTSAGRADDVQSALLNSIRDAVYTMYYQTEYQAASDALNGGRGPRPTVLIATDPVIARYLDTNTNIKILSGSFDVKIVTTLDTRMEGKMYITFGVYDSSRNEVVNPLQFGCMAWASEVTSNIQVSRGGQTSKEISVSPRFRHIVNLPAMLEFKVTNLDVVQGRVAQKQRV